MEPFSIKANSIGLLFATLLSWRGIRKKGLTPAGAACAFFVGFCLMATGIRGFNLIVFYLIATKATKFKKDHKEKIDGSLSITGTIARGPTQVLACSLLAVVLSLFHGIYCGEEKPIDFQMQSQPSKLACGIVAHHATCLADTLASELGILAKSSPVLVTQPWRKVPPGTNGGITSMGCFWSALGGFLIGLSTILLDAVSGLFPIHMLRMIAFSSCCGLAGSLIDSILGATIQQSHWDPETRLAFQANDEKPKSTKVVAGRNLLTNEQVNLASVAMTTFLGGWILGPIFFE
eukprot:scaffold154_cov129-Cylindrotheca_fusiformis.AAC.18